MLDIAIFEQIADLLATFLQVVHLDQPEKPNNPTNQINRLL